MKIKNRVKCIILSLIYIPICVNLNVYTQNRSNEDTKSTIEVSNSQEYSKVAYITIDDGPSKYTNQILNILDNNNVKATFFFIDRNMKKFPEKVKQVNDSKHKIGLHGITHDINKLYKSKVSARDEFDKNNKTLYNIVGEYTSLIRVPYGSKPHMPKNTYNNLVECGYQIWDWTIDTEDWKSTPEEIIDSVKVSCTNKDDIIILIHEKRQTVECLDEVIKFLKDEGYGFGVLDDSKTPKNFWNAK